MKKGTFKAKILLVFAAIALAMIGSALVVKNTFLANFNAKADALYSAKIETRNGDFGLNSVDFINKAAELIGKPYLGGEGSQRNGKGVTGDPWTKNRQGNLLSASEVQGVDCSGLVYWALSQLGASTEGFSFNNPVPVDTTHWWTYGSNGIPFKEANTGSTKSVFDAGLKITVNGATSSINVLKANENITDNYRYYNYTDASGNVQELPMGTIIISRGKAINCQDHAWITLGNLKTTNAAEAQRYLASKGVNIDVKYFNSTNNTCTYWRIESNGNDGVTINNGDPNIGKIEYGNTKGIGPIWAFQVSNYPVYGEYEVEAVKVDENGNAINLSEKVFKITRNGNELNSSISSSDSSRVISDRVALMEGEKSTFVIEETKAPGADYVKLDKKLKVEITGTYNRDFDRVIGKVTNLWVVDSENNEVPQSIGLQGEFQYENGMIDFQNDEITGRLVVKFKNNKIKGNYKLAILKTDATGNKGVNGSEFDVKKINMNSSNSFEGNWENVGLIGNEAVFDTNSIEINSVDVSDVYQIEEKTTPAGYQELGKTIVLQVNKKVNGSQYLIDSVRVLAFDSNEEFDASNITSSENLVGTINEANKTVTYENEGRTFLVELSNDNSIIKVFVRNKIVDLALKKRITKVNDTNVTKHNGFNTGRNVLEGNGITGVDTDGVDVTSLAESTNATYFMNKKPVEVAIGDTIEYSIKVFNEGEVKARASKITDYIPNGLKVVGVKYAGADLTSYQYDEANGVLKIDLTEQGNLLDAFANNLISRDEVTVICEVKDNAEGILTNVAEITEYMDETGIIENDVDSTPNNWNAPNGEDKLTNSKDSNDWRNYNTNPTANDWSDGYVAQDTGLNGNKGDDDDFDRVIVLKNEEFKLTINKVDAENPNSGISDVLFNITKKFDDNAVEEQENVRMVDAKITDTQSISPNKENKIIYTIQEVPDSLNRYLQLDGTIKLEVNTKDGKIENYSVAYKGKDSQLYTIMKRQLLNEDSITVELKSSNGNKFNVAIQKTDRSIDVTIPNKLIANEKYGLRLRKVSSNNGAGLAGVTFNGTDGQAAIGLNATDTDGYTNQIVKDITVDNYEEIDEYNISEIDLGANTGYTKLTTPISVEVAKELTMDGKLKVKNYTVTVNNQNVIIDERNTSNKINIKDENGINYTITVALETVNNVSTLTITVPNAPDTTVPLKLIKVSTKDGSPIAGTGFSIYKFGTETLVYNGETLTEGVTIEDKVEAGTRTIEYQVVEDYAATGFVNTLSGKSLKLTVNETDGVVQTATVTVLNGDGTEADDQSIASVAVESGAAVLTVQNTPVVKNVDLALKKVITKVDGHEVKANSTINFPEKFERTTDGKIRVFSDPLRNEITDAKYYLNKTPIEVLRGSRITYEIRIYNEGEVDATAGQIIDYLPNNMKFESVSYNGETLTEGTDYTFNSQTNTLRINVLEGKDLIAKYNPNNDILSMEYVTVECTVLDSAEGILTNVAEISKYIMDDDGERKVIDKDIDSESGNWRNQVTGKTADNESVDRDNSSWEGYIGERIGPRRNTYEEGKFKNYLGEEDDDDFEKVKVVELDLALKKVITQINNKTEEQFNEGLKRFQDSDGERKIVTNVKGLNRIDYVTTAEYYMNKTPITVAIGDEISYQIRIYNEGSIDATASEIKDYIPKGLKFDSIYLGDSETALTSGYSYNEETNVLTITALKDNFIDKYNGGIFNLIDPSYKYVTVKCKVTGECTGIITNVAEITEYQTFYGETEEDRDSQTTGEGEWQEPEGSNKDTLDGKSGDKWNDYYDSTSDGEFNDYPGQQDDDDFEKILVLGYNLKIQKYSDWAVYGLENAKFNVNGEEYTTNENGVIDLGWKTLDSTPTSAGGYTIEEISAENHVAIDEQIVLNLTKTIYNGRPRISGFTLKIGNNEYTTEIDGSRSNLYWLNGQRLFVNVSIDRNGCYSFEIVINNRHEKQPYELYVRKVDSSDSDKGINGTKFEVTPLDIVIEEASSGPWGIGRTNTFETNDDGTAKIGRFLLNKNEWFSQSDELSDVFKIEEIETPSRYVKIADDQDIYLTVNKKVNKDAKGNNLSMTVDSVKLTLNKQTSNPVETEAGKKVTLTNVATEKAGKTVNVIAEVKDVVDETTGKTVPTIVVTVPNNQKEYDLSLRKYILNVENEKEPKEVNRWATPAIDVSTLIEGTTATYNNAKDQVQVHLLDTVLYGISVYNEGERGGYAELVMDDVPEGLEMIAPGDGTNETSSVNAKYRWKMYRLAKDGDSNVVTFDGVSYVETSDASEAKVIVTDYLSKAYGEVLRAEANEVENPNFMKAFDASSMNEPISRALNVEFKVKTSNKENDIITNKAQIIEHGDEDGNKVPDGLIDRDSTPNKWEDSPRDDDQDIEHLIVLRDKIYDLALRKFIVKVNGEKLTSSREPRVDCTKLINGGHDAEYNHSKEPVLLNTNDIVEYTIRVYNEGKDDAYAEIVMDDVPEAAEMVLPEYAEDGTPMNLNAEYGWKMFRALAEGEVPESGAETVIYKDKAYVRTNKAEEAVIITTDYLSHEKNAKANLIKAFDPSIGLMTVDNFRDLKVEFKITEKEIGNLVYNYAQIYEMRDEDGGEAEDIDSTPGVWVDDEDDQDIEVVKVGKFDLALYKWVTQAIVIENGKTAEYDSKHTQMDKANVVNVTIPKNSLNKVTVKFKYQIKVENEGSIAGKALEIKDHIPAGLKFVAEDNTEFGWVAVDDNTIVTDYLKDTVLQPGESTEVTVVLTWVNGAKNFGEKVNYAEISKDYNEYGWPDIDSTPDNFKDIPNEDDEDGDVVLLQIRTGIENVIYVVIAVTAMAIVVGGVVAIKKYVVNNVD